MVSLHILRVATLLGCLIALQDASAQTASSGSSRKPGATIVEHNPFEEYARVADSIYVYDRSQFVRYTGPAVPTLSTDENNAVEGRRRLGTIAIAPGMRLMVEATTQPMSQNYELRDTKTGELVHEFSYYGAVAAPLLFTGQGTVFDYAELSPLCWGSVTRKYEFVGGKFVEVQQPFRLLVNAETELLRNVQLLSSPNEASAPVASLSKGMKATVITFEQPDRFLIKTPLGLTGWLIDKRSESSLSITQCN